MSIPIIMYNESGLIKLVPTMVKLTIVLMTFSLFSCTNKLEKHSPRSVLNKEMDQLDVVFDTLAFKEEMNSDLLIEKYASGLAELHFYKQFVSDKKINKKQIFSEAHSKTEISYLGKLMDLNQQQYYHVITNFKVIGIGEMESPRGASYLVFLNENLDKAIIYRMGLPDELPEKIENDILYFTLDSKKVGISLIGGLPPMLCLPFIGCN